MATSNNKNNKNGKREKADWFEALCTMGESSDKSKSAGKNSSTTAKNTRKSGASNTASRTRVQNRSDDPFENDRPPFDDADIPPFDASEETVADSVFKEQSASGRSKSQTQRKSRSTQSGKGKSAGKGTAASTRAKTKQSMGGERRVADVIYFLQPYAVFLLGALLAIEMLLSFFMSGGEYAWTRDTQPFRWFGYYLEYLLFGLFGYGAYLVPAMMMYLSFDRLRNGKRRTGKGIMASGIVLLLPAVIHVCLVNAAVAGVPDTARIGELYTTGAAHMSAGVIPGLLAYIFNVGLGVIGTVIVGVFLLLLLGVLLVGLTPAMLWERLREAMQDRKEKTRRVRDREMELREERGLAPRDALVRSALDPEQKAAADMDRRIHRRLDREQERMEQEALREAERSDRMERAKTAKRRAAPPTVQSEPSEDEFDPVGALISRQTLKDTQQKAEKKQDKDKAPKKKKEEENTLPVAHMEAADELPDMTAVDESVKEDTLDAIFGEVIELPEEEDPAYARKEKSKKGRAVEIPAEEEKPEEDELNVYPAHAEIELDLEAPMPEDDEIAELFTGGATVVAAPAEPSAAPAEAEIMPADIDELYEDMDGALLTDEEEGMQTLQGDGGVTIKVETLTREERERGAKIVTPAQKEEFAKVRPYTFPKIDLLEPEPGDGGVTEVMLQQKAIRLRDTLTSFNVRVESVTYVGGPTVTRYEVKPAPGVKVASITRLSDDIAMGLESSGAVRIEAPIPGKNAVGIEVPNDKRNTVYLRGLIDAETFKGAKSRVTCCLGKGVGGMSVYLDINKMPHLLIAGATGTGKSVCINSLIMSLLYKAKPDEVKLLMIDPKTVEFSVYKDIPHLMAPIICDPKRAAGALNLAVQEMERRYELMRTVGVRNIAGYNTATENDRYEHPYIPQMVIIIDELADLMMTAKNEVEASIVRLAQKARAAGIHLILGTQRPSVDVITGLIKANVPSRISFTVTSQIDSRTILDNAGAEKLLGMGDMLYAPIGSSKPQRVQGCFVSDDEVERIVDYIRRNNDEVRYDQNFLDNLDREAELIGNKREARDEYDDDGEIGDLDPKFYEALGVAVKNKRISTSLLQRTIMVGYGRAAKILDQMEEKGFIGPASGNKPREILISEEAYRELMVNQD
ncbi:MAG: DUF87 domain-containing protein [Clostridia bacterium]|nr:DUF87 domain-containing protein [Clostridia bacterium]